MRERQGCISCGSEDRIEKMRRYYIEIGFLHVTAPICDECEKQAVEDSIRRTIAAELADAND